MLGPFEQKPPELLEAQIAAFAPTIPDRADQEYLLENTHELITKGLRDVIRTTTEQEWTHTEDGGNVRIPAGTTKTVAVEDYGQFLRKVAASNNESIRVRAEMFGAYPLFEAEVTEIKRAWAAHEISPIGSGFYSDTFVIRHPGLEYVVRIPRPDEGVSVPYQVNRYLSAAVLCRGEPRMEQVVAASLKNGVTIAERLPGKDAHKLTVDELQSVTDAHLATLVDTYMSANRRGIYIDFHGEHANALLDPTSGFSLFDCESAQEEFKRRGVTQGLGDVIGEGVFAITDMGSSAGLGGELDTAKLELMHRYRSLVAQKLERDDRIQALQFVDAEIAHLN